MSTTAQATGNCLVIDKQGEQSSLQMQTRTFAEPGPDEVLVKVEYSSVNYKDALAATAHSGVALKLPLIPGIDAAGRVIESNCPMVAAGQQVLIAHEDFGTRQDGGWADYAVVPGHYVMPLPESLSAEQAMALGTAGFTAAQSLMALQDHGVLSDRGPVLVTGATGGVGSLAVQLLSHLQYDVVAVTGKADRHEWLKSLGATTVLPRDEFLDSTDRPLLSGRFAGVIDTVGGDILATAIRSTQRGGCVTACGHVAGEQLSLTVYPFILRGVVLVGIDSAGVDPVLRNEIWTRLAGKWSISREQMELEMLHLQEVPFAVQKMLTGKMAGRILVKLSEK